MVYWLFFSLIKIFLSFLLCHALRHICHDADTAIAVALLRHDLLMPPLRCRHDAAEFYAITPALDFRRQHIIYGAAIIID